MARTNKNAIYNKLLQAEIDKNYAEQRRSGIVRAGEIESVLVGLRTAMELFKACMPDVTEAVKPTPSVSGALFNDLT